MFVVELGTSPEAFYLATWSGDPGRTFCLSSARQYETRRGAAIGLGMARSQHRPFLTARIVDVATCPKCGDTLEDGGICGCYR